MQRLSLSRCDCVVCGKIPGMNESTGDDNEAAPGFSDEQHRDFVYAINQRMPFGKFEGTHLIDLPEPYLVWFKQQGFPQGKLGRQMALVYEIKLNGLESTFRPLLFDASDK